MEFVVEDIKHINVKVNGKWFDLAEFAEHFILSFSVTVYKYKGADIYENYNIYDVKRID